nr:conserved hypothetical protein [Hymenolepis microstoma]
MKSPPYFFAWFIDLLIGIPHVHHDDIDKRLLEERLEFSVSELTAKGANRQALEAFWNFAERISYLPEDIDLGEEGKAPTPPYNFITPSKLLIDLRTYDNQLLERCLAVINQLRQEVHDNWFEDFKNSLYIDLKRAGKPNDEIKNVICARGLKEYAKRLFEAMRASEDLYAINPTIAEALIQEATFSLAVTESKADLCDSWLAHEATAEARLQRDHPILWSILSWRKQQLSKIKEAFMQEHRFNVHKSVIKKCHELGLHQHGYFVKRDLLFLTERERRIREELLKTSVSPDNRFEFKVLCKMMRHWKVYREDTIFPHHRERVDCVLLLGQQPNEVTIEDAREPGSQCESNLNKSKYSVTKHREFKSSTRYAFWRWHTFFIATWVLLLHSSQLFFYTIPFRSPLSFTALFQREPIQLSADVDQKTGYLYYTNKRKCQTLHSRLSRLWKSARAAANSRGRSNFRRPCIFFSASFLSLFLILLMTPLCLLLSTLSIAFGLVALPLIPLVSLVFHIFCVLLYDFYKPAIHANGVLPIAVVFIWHLGIRCILQFIMALLWGLVLYPIASLIWSVFGVLRWCLRSLWDTTIFHLCLRLYLRIPANDNYILKRRAGPGLSPMHFHKARLADVCAILESQLETIEVDEWRAQMDEIAREPIRAYNSLAENLAWLSLSPVEKGIFSQLRGQTKAWLEEILQKAKQRKEALHPKFPRCQATRLKLSANELQKFIIIGATQTQRFYETRILPRLQLLNKNPEEWWSRRGLRTDDYSGLCMRLMKTILGEQFLTSLKETDTVFPLHVRQKAIVSRFAQVVPPTPFIARRFPTTIEPTSPEKTEGLHENKIERNQLTRLSTKTSSLPSILRQKRATGNTGEPAKHLSYPLMRDQGGYENDGYDLEDQSSIDVDLDKSDLSSSSGALKRQTVILKSSKQQPQNASGDFPDIQVNAEEDISMESLVFIHVELPLFPLSTFVPKILQEAAAAKHNMETDLSRSNRNGCKRAGKIQRVKEQSTINKDENEHIEGLATLLKEERTPILGTLPLATKLSPPVTEFKKTPFNRWFIKAFRNVMRRTLTCNWKLQKCPRAQKELSIGSVIENIGRVMHPVEIVLTMHSRILEEHKIDRANPILVKCIMELTSFPPQCPSPTFNLNKSPLRPIQQQIQTLEFVTAQSTPNPRHYSLRNDSVMHLSHSLEVPSERALEGESPVGRGRDWDQFNLASWWDVESRRGRDYLEITRESGDFYAAITDTTTSAYEETEDLDDDDFDPDNDEIIDFNPLVKMPEMVINNAGGEGKFFSQPLGPDCFLLAKVGSNGVNNKTLDTSTTTVQNLQSKQTLAIVTSTSSEGGWPILRMESSCSLGKTSAAALSSSTSVDGNNLGSNPTDHHSGPLSSVAQSIASHSSVRQVPSDRSVSQNFQID